VQNVSALMRFRRELYCNACVSIFNSAQKVNFCRETVNTFKQLLGCLFQEYLVKL